jgi:tRNA (adenine37-N6)-methyltransferase
LRLGNRDVAWGQGNAAAVARLKVEREMREGEMELGFDPAASPGDARLVFIGRIRSPWTKREDCPKNMREARDRGMPASAEIDAPYRAGLEGLERASHVVLLSWFDRALRNLIMQKPRQSPVASGTFALRSPARPNPIGLHVARLVSIDREAGLLEIDAIDALDGTPLLDLKPYFASIDAMPEATVRPAEG